MLANFNMQSQAVAYTLRQAADEAGPQGSVVALVNLGTLASLQRNWEVSAVFIIINASGADFNRACQ